MSGVRYFVDGPRPLPPRYRLIDTANIVTEDVTYWQGITQVWGYPPDLPEAWDPCSTGTDRIKVEGGSIPLPEFGAFVVYVAETCTTRSIGYAGQSLQEMQDAYVARAMATFAAVESFAVEDQLANGTVLPANPYLGDASMTPLNGTTPVASKAALGFLENAIGATGRAGMIHATPAIASVWGQFRLKPEAGVLRSTVGTPIVVGDGYIGSTPVEMGTNVNPTGTDWAYATGPVELRRSEVQIYPETVQQAMAGDNTNTITYRVERTYLAAWDTVLQAGILVDWTTG